MTNHFSIDYSQFLAAQKILTGYRTTRNVKTGEWRLRRENLLFEKITPTYSASTTRIVRHAPIRIDILDDAPVFEILSDDSKYDFKIPAGARIVKVTLYGGETLTLIVGIESFNQMIAQFSGNGALQTDGIIRKWSDISTGTLIEPSTVVYFDMSFIKKVKIGTVSVDIQKDKAITYVNARVIFNSDAQIPDLIVGISQSELIEVVGNMLS